jgi:hypothetical protein
LVIFVVEAGAGGRLLRAGRLTCPGCAGRLRVWTAARERIVSTLGGGRISLTPDRGLCTGCGSTHVVLPAWYVPRRGYTIEVVGQVLLGGARGAAVRAIAEGLTLPVTTVGTWLRQAHRAAGALLRHACVLAGLAVGEGRSPASWLGNALAEALAALGDAARTLAGDATPTRAACCPDGSGIDYLGLLADRRHAQVLRQLHVADPDHALTGATPWQLVNLITARRGLLAPEPA